MKRTSPSILPRILTVCILAAGLLAANPLTVARAQAQDLSAADESHNHLGASSDDGTPSADPREGLAPGWTDAGEAVRNLRLIAHAPRPADFINPDDPADFGYVNTDLAFSGDLLFLGSYNGIQVWDISTPEAPELRATHVCPGGQGDVSVFGDLLFMSVEEVRGRIDCAPGGVPEAVSPERFRGVRIFDVSTVEEPTQIAAVQTCRGSHTHTLVTDPNDDQNVYVYVSGTSPVRPGEELAGCSSAPPEEDPNTSLFQIEVIRVPLDRPQDAEVINTPRIFADEESGDIAGLWRGGPHGEGTQNTSETDQCHDITVYPELGLAAGACSGNGILLDISEPSDPRRIEEVSDPNFAYWHSATFSNDGSTVLFTDEWGGGVAPRCRESDLPEWGADAIFTLENGELTHKGYFKIPAAQTAQENCVAHNGSLIPVPGRDILVQAWYQGGISVVDFTDPDHPIEIAYFDRGPVDSTRIVIGGYWSAYWYNGRIYGSEMARGLDVFELTPSELLSENEIEAAKQVTFDEFNPQLQTRLEWPASFAVARSYLDQLDRSRGVGSDLIGRVRAELDRAERSGIEPNAERLEQAAVAVEDASRGGSVDAERLQLLAETVRAIAGAS